MKDTFLKQLTNKDIQWLKQNATLQKIEQGSTIIQPEQGLNLFYLLIRGELIATISQNQGGRLGRVFAALEDEQDLEMEIAHYTPGEVLGKIPLVELTLASMTVKATENSALLAISIELLRDKLENDIGFAARFYRGIAILLLERFGKLIPHFLRYQRGQIQPLQDVPLIFGELSDSDVDWMLGVGQLMRLSRGEELIHSGEAMENLYVILQGAIAVSVQEAQPSRLASLFAALESEAEDREQGESLEREIIRLSRGEIIGETIALDNPLSNSSLRALENSLLLKISQRQLLVKLQQDFGISARFYRVISMLISARLEGLISRLGYGRSSYQLGESLAQEDKYEDEIDLELMDNLTLGGVRFDWMLKRLKVS